MHPILFEIRGLEVGTYALFALLALGTLATVFAWLGARAGHQPMRLVELILWTCIIGLMSSKLFAVMKDLDATDPWGSAMESFRYAGHYLVGFFAGSAFLLAGLRFIKMPVGLGLDLVAPGLALGHGVGRIGCFFAGCCWGAPCDAPWALVFTSERAHRLTGVPLNVGLHPTQLYEAGIELGIGALLLWWILRARTYPLPRPGSTFLGYIALYGFARFGLEFLRDDPRGIAFGMPTSQPVALATALGATIILVYWTLGARRVPARAATRGRKK